MLKFIIAILVLSFGYYYYQPDSIPMFELRTCTSVTCLETDDKLITYEKKIPPIIPCTEFYDRFDYKKYIIKDIKILDSTFPNNVQILMEKYDIITLKNNQRDFDSLYAGLLYGIEKMNPNNIELLQFLKDKSSLVFIVDRKYRYYSKDEYGYYTQYSGDAFKAYSIICDVFNKKSNLFYSLNMWYKLKKKN